MVRTFRFALVALLLGAGLLLPVLLRGQASEQHLSSAPRQPWAPGVAPTVSHKPAVIATTSPGAPEPKSAAPPPLRRYPLPDDGLSSPPSVSTPPAPGKAPSLQRPTPSAREPMPIPPSLQSARPLQPQADINRDLQQVSLRPTLGPVSSPQTVAATPTAPHVPTPQATGVMTSVSNSVLSVEILGPPRVTLDDLLPCELVVRNLGATALAGVQVELPLPQGLRFVTAYPMPEVQPDRLVWQIGSLEVRGERRLRTDLMAKATDAIALQPQATYLTGVAYRPEVERPAFSVSQLGPDAVPRGTTLTLQLQLTNHGVKPLHKVVLWDRLPAGLYHPQGTNIYAEVGQLAPGESRVIKLDVVAQRSGRWVNEIVAEAEGMKKTISRSPVVVTEPSLTARLIGPERVNVAGEIQYRLEVTNGRQGSTARNIRLTQTLPDGLDALEATTQGQIDARSRRIVWKLGTLEPGQMQTVFVKARCMAPGSWTTQVALDADQIATTQTEHTVVGEGGCQLGLQVKAADGGLEVGADTVYEVRLTNLGAETGKNVRVSAWVPEGLAPLRVDGPYGGRIQLQHVLFESIPTLATKASSVYHLRVRGQRTGTWRMQVEAMADQMARPLVEEVTVQVLPDPRTQSRPGVLNTLED